MLRKIQLHSAVAACLAVLAASCVTQSANAPARPHNIIIFVADGLRYGSVNDQDGPAFMAVRREGVDFANSHSVYPTVTTANASAIATGHYLGDTGNYANAIYPGEPWLEHSGFSRVIFLEDDNILADMDGRFGGNYVHEQTLLAAAQAHGFDVASIGKVGPTGIQLGHAPGTGEGILVDESLGLPGGPTLPADIAPLLQTAHLDPTPPPRNRPNRAQQDWFTTMTTDVLLPRFAASGKPFVLLFWSPDPDNTQHGQTDSPNALTPGINGPTSRAAIANASSDLARIRAALAANHLDTTTDVIVIADHGFSTISKESHTSYSATLNYRDYPHGQLPPGFLAIDLSHALGLNLFNPNGLDVALNQGLPPRGASAILGPDHEHPHIIVGANGGTDLIYLPGNDATQLAPRIVQFLTTQDYVSAIFVADSFGQIPGALPMSAINLEGAAVTPHPAIVVSFRSYDTGCGNPELCGVEIADTPLAQGQGMHGALSRADTRNFMAAVGPDFRAGTVDPQPVSNADVAWTAAQILGIHLQPGGRLYGRLITESLMSNSSAHGQQAQDGIYVQHEPVPVTHVAETIRSVPAANGFVTVLNRQRVADTRYFDAAGAPGRAVGLHE